MGLRKYLGLERRRQCRYLATLEVEFQVWNAARQEPLTPTVKGRLTDISSLGACLQTNHTIIEGHHLLLDNDPEGNTPLVLKLASPGSEAPWSIKAQALWYNRVDSERRYLFDVGLKFVDLSPEQKQKLEALLQSLAAS